MPTRIQRKRTAGWKKPQGAVYVGRGTRWGNPWVIAETGTGWAVSWAGARDQVPHGLRTEVIANDRRDAHALAVELYENWLYAQTALLERARKELAGRDLMCWCSESLPCHADVLLAVAGKASSHD
jgi:hypothetical protein